MTHLGPTVPRTEAAPPPERAEFYLTLSRAFLPPTDAAFRRALVDDLADALEELAEILELPVGSGIAALRAACARSDADSADGGVLLAYSRLFLVPPFAVPLNAGIVLDGAPMGTTTQVMEDWYARHGLKREETFHDMPDHVSMQLEFLALLLERTTQDGEDSEPVAWARKMLLPWIDGLSDRIAAAGAEHAVPDHPYGALASILSTALAHDFAKPAEEPSVTDLEAAAAAAAAAATGEDALCILCNAYIGVEGELATVERILTEKGLPTGHLRVCPECRDGSKGYTHKPIPGVDRLTGEKTAPRQKGG